MAADGGDLRIPRRAAIAARRAGAGNPTREMTDE
jgi:hypothetical protein